MRIALLITSILVLSGCASTSKDELLKSENNIRYCYTYPADELASSIKHLFDSCFQASSTSTMIAVNGAFVPMKFEHHWNIADDITPLGHVYTVELESATLSSFVLAAEVRDSSGSCKSTLHLFARNKKWSETSFEAINKSIMEKSVICPTNLRKSGS